MLKASVLRLRLVGPALDIDDAFVDGYVDQVVELVIARIPANGRFHPFMGRERQKDYERPRSR
jgi:hypothetical protein